MSGGDLGGLNEAGGIFAGGVALLAAVGGGLRWLLNWSERRLESRAVKLQRWHDELTLRETRLDAERENEIRDIRLQLEQVRGEHRALFQAYHLIAGALVKLDPSNPALRAASRLLSTAFKVDPGIPDDMADLLRQAK